MVAPLAGAVARADPRPGCLLRLAGGGATAGPRSGFRLAPQHIIMDYTAAPNSPTLVPAEPLVDYVRVWQRT